MTAPAQPQEQEYTIPRMNARPVTLTGEIIAEAAADDGSSSRSKGDARARLFRATNGAIAYLMERLGGEEPALIESAIWESENDIPWQSLWGGPKVLLRKAGMGDKTYEVLTPAPWSQRLVRTAGPDIVFGGTLLASREVPFVEAERRERRKKSGHEWGTVGRALVALYRVGDEYWLFAKEGVWERHTFSSALDLYRDLLWFGYEKHSLPAPPEPQASTLALLTDAGKLDAEIARIVSPPIGGPDPVAEYWAERHQEWTAENNIRRAKWQVERAEQERLQAEQWERERQEEEARQRTWEAEQQKLDRREKQTSRPPIVLSPSPEVEAKDWLTAMSRSFVTPGADGQFTLLSKTVAAAALYLGDVIEKAGQSRNWGEY